MIRLGAELAAHTPYWLGTHDTGTGQRNLLRRWGGRATFLIGLTGMAAGEAEAAVLRVSSAGSTTTVFAEGTHRPAGALNVQVSHVQPLGGTVEEFTPPPQTLLYVNLGTPYHTEIFDGLWLLPRLELEDGELRVFDDTELKATLALPPGVETDFAEYLFVDGWSGMQREWIDYTNAVGASLQTCQVFAALGLWAEANGETVEFDAGADSSQTGEPAPAFGRAWPTVRVYGLLARSSVPDQLQHSSGELLLAGLAGEQVHLYPRGGSCAWARQTLLAPPTGTNVDWFSGLPRRLYWDSAILAQQVWPWTTSLFPPLDIDGAHVLYSGPQLLELETGVVALVGDGQPHFTQDLGTTIVGDTPGLIENLSGCAALQALITSAVPLVDAIRTANGSYAGLAFDPVTQELRCLGASGEAVVASGAAELYRAWLRELPTGRLEVGVASATGLDRYLATDSSGMAWELADSDTTPLASVGLRWSASRSVTEAVVGWAGGLRVRWRAGQDWTWSEVLTAVVGATGPATVWQLRDGTWRLARWSGGWQFYRADHPAGPWSEA